MMKPYMMELIYKIYEEPYMMEHIYRIHDGTHIYYIHDGTVYDNTVELAALWWNLQPCVYYTLTKSTVQDEKLL